MLTIYRWSSENLPQDFLDRKHLCSLDPGYATISEPPVSDLLALTTDSFTVNVLENCIAIVRKNNNRIEVRNGNIEGRISFFSSPLPMVQDIA